MNLWYYDFPIAGRLGIVENGEAITRIFLPDDPKAPCGTEARTPLLDRAAAQLSEYFSGQRRTFSLPISMDGTPFQLRVWGLLTRIPYGQTTTYGALARQLFRSGGAQAVGQAVGANPLPFLIPCHRVIGSDGSITGYALGLEMKRALLALENLR